MNQIDDRLKFPSLTSFLIIFAILGFCSSVAESERDVSAAVIHQVTEKDGGGVDMCAAIPSPASCPINCFRADPVCGADGVTYWCGCPDAICHGARVAKLGACEVGSNGGSASLPGQALLLVHIVWLILLGFSLLLGLF